MSFSKRVSCQQWFPRATPGPVEPTRSGTIEIEFAAGARMRITGTVDAATLKAALAALTEGQRR